MAISYKIEFAQAQDVDDILGFIKALAKYEKLEHEVVASKDKLHETLFGKNKYAEVIILKEGDKNAGFALFFHNYSTFLAKPGIYLEDLFVDPEFRGKGYGKALLKELAKIAIARGCGRLDWAVLDWNTPAIDFYKSVNAEAKTDWIPFRLQGQALIEMAK